MQVLFVATKSPLTGGSDGGPASQFLSLALKNVSLL
jgi:hypothetical protein